MNLRERLIAEFAGTALLLAAIVGSGMMAEKLAGGSVGLALLANSIATAGVLYALIAALGPISGAHFNPVVTIAMAVRGDLPRGLVASYIVVQIAGAVVGVWLAHLMFELPMLQLGVKVRTGPAQWLAEAVATFGLLLVIWHASRHAAVHVPAAVAGYIAGAYWFTASTSFANPAVTLALSLTDSFAGIRPLELLEPLRLFDIQAAILFAPAVVVLLGELCFLTGLSHRSAFRHQHVDLAQLRDRCSALFRFFGVFGLPFQADYLSQPGPETHGQVISASAAFGQTRYTDGCRRPPPAREFALTSFAPSAHLT